MSDERHCVRVRIEGRVQGVGYRAFVEREATKHNIAGFVRNRCDGSVEAVFVASHDAVNAIVEACRGGPRGARVDALFEFDELEDATMTTFEVRATV